MKVKAVRDGYFGVKRRRKGVVFNIKDAEAFSSKWMEPIGWVPKGYKPKVTVAKKRADVDIDDAMEAEAEEQSSADVDVI